jgi:hypothetical protein
MPFGGLLTVGAIGAGTSLLGGLFGSSAASNAAKEQEQAEQKGINFLGQEQQQGMANYSPYLSAGSTASGTLSSLLGTPGSGLLTPWSQQFTAPTAAQAAQTPGYQFQLQQGLNAAQNSAAGQGSLLSGRTLADLNNYAQGTASTNYQNTFNNALTQYNSAYNTFQNNQNNEYSRLMGVSGQGLTAAQGAGGLLSNLGGDTASLMAGQGAAAAAGTIGSANAWSGALSGVGNAATNMMMLSQLNGMGTSGGGGFLPAADSATYGSAPFVAGGSMPSTPGSIAAPYSGLQMPAGYTGSAAPTF